MCDIRSPNPRRWFRMRNSDPAMGLSIPRHFLEHQGHRAEVGEPGEGEAQTNESAEKDPVRIVSQSHDGAGQHEQTRAQTDLALEGPTRLHIGHDRQTSVDPCFGAALENGDLPLAGFQQVRCHAGARASLADENDGEIDGEIVETGLDLIHGILTAPGMWPEANSEAERTSTSRVRVDPGVRSSATVMVGLKIPPIWEEREFWEKDSRAVGRVPKLVQMLGILRLRMMMLRTIMLRSG
jgi:hypothetical protein